MYTVVSPIMVQLLNATAVCFLVGSVLFILGSIIFLFTFTCPSDAELLYEYAGWLFIAGSILFTVGALVNGWRSFRGCQFHNEWKKKCHDLKEEVNVSKEGHLFHQYKLLKLHQRDVSKTKNQVVPEEPNNTTSLSRTEQEPQPPLLSNQSPAIEESPTACTA
eukprot:Awhi_evm1s10953